MAQKKYNQLVVWQGTTLGDQDPKDLVSWFKKELLTRIKWCEQVVTLPDVKNGKKVSGTGGRNDLLFYVHDDDISSFAIKRFQLGGCSWWEDVVSYNDNSYLYPEEVLKKYEVKW